jgi:hypothetical protein
MTLTSTSSSASSLAVTWCGDTTARALAASLRARTRHGTASHGTARHDATAPQRRSVALPDGTSYACADRGV